MPVRWSPPWNSSYGGVFMQIQLKHYDFSLRTSVPVSLAWARCAFASSLVIQGSACLDSLLICSCHPITTSKDVTLGRKTGWSEGNKKKKKNMERCSFFYWSTIQTRTGLTFFFFYMFFFSSQSPPFWIPLVTNIFFFFTFPFLTCFGKKTNKGFLVKKKNNNSSMELEATCPHHQTPAAAAWRCGWGGPFFLLFFFVSSPSSFSLVSPFS